MPAPDRPYDASRDALRGMLAGWGTGEGGDG